MKDWVKEAAAKLYELVIARRWHEALLWLCVVLSLVFGGYYWYEARDEGLWDPARSDPRFAVPVVFIVLLFLATFIDWELTRAAGRARRRPPAAWQRAATGVLVVIGTAAALALTWPKIPRFESGGDAVNVLVARFYCVGKGARRLGEEAQRTLKHHIEGAAAAEKQSSGLVVLPLPEAICDTVTARGRERAREVAEVSKADLVVWGSIQREVGKPIYFLRFTAGGPAAPRTEAWGSPWEDPCEGAMLKIPAKDAYTAARIVRALGLYYRHPSGGKTPKDYVDAEEILDDVLRGSSGDGLSIRRELLLFTLGKCIMAQARPGTGREPTPERQAPRVELARRAQSRYSEALTELGRGSRGDERTADIHFRWGIAACCVAGGQPTPRGRDARYREALAEFDRALADCGGPASTATWLRPNARFTSALAVAARADGQTRPEVARRLFEQAELGFRGLATDDARWRWISGVELGTVFLNWARREAGEERRRLLGCAEKELETANRAPGHRGSMHYGLAALSALRQETDKCRTHLQSGIAAGTITPDDADDLAYDPNFESVQRDGWFRRLVEGLEQRRDAHGGAGD